MASFLPSNNIILTGFMGCGKSYFASRLANVLEYALEDTDKMIENYEKRSIKDIFAHHGEDYFRSLEAKIAPLIKQFDKTVVATGGGFPVYYKDIKDLGLVVYMDISFEEILRRMDADELIKRPLFNDIDQAKKLFDQRENIYKERSHFQLDASQPIETMIEQTQSFLLKQSTV